ncbi:hypothetical protein [Nocardia sp. NPDC057353]|uniref:hypothetical protein n=1 Tax=Nocardia sp. NPDC057353 TaxID=3346104 RepID=UPI00362F796D
MTMNISAGGAGRDGVIGATEFAWLMLAVAGGIVYGTVVRATDCPMLAAVGSGVAGGVAVFGFLWRQDWKMLLTSRRGWILTGSSFVIGCAGACIPAFTIESSRPCMQLLGAVAAGAFVFGLAVETTDNFIRR